MPTLPDWAIQALQVISILALAPLVAGIIARAEAVIQQRRGPRVLQPYHDILKLLAKQTVLPAPAGLAFRAAPYVSFAGYATIPLLIPALTSFPLPLGYEADFFGVGMILALASFSVSIAAIDSGSPYAQLGSSRLRSFGAFNEPTVIFVTFVLALTTHTDLPYAFGATLRSAVVQVVRPSHLLMIAAFFMLVLNETGRIPIESHGSTLEFGQIEEARVAEHSGPGLAFLRWGSNVKQLLLFTIFSNVLVAPWGLASSGRIGAVALAIVLLVAKALAVGVAIVVIESSFAKLRLYKIPEFTVASFMLSVLAVVIFIFQPSFGNEQLSVFGAFATIGAVVVLLAEYGMLRSQDVWEQVRLYSLASVVVAALAIATAATGHGSSGLYVLGAATIALKALLFPLAITVVLRRLGSEPRVPSLIGAPSAILLAVVLSSLVFVVLRPIHIGGVQALPLSALPVAVGGVVVALLLMILRPHAPSQLLGFLALENAVTVASLVIAPGLPIILGLLLLFDVLVGVLVFVVLVQYLAMERTAVRTDILNRLTG
ncbi:MAG TPA: NADH-quinone oxidoreductase subunit H [Solirubrobacteraceae bacterium]|nr:NADH-quinone oxidoreductase subunit H [Solirubrobacteraceae bacterium]